MRVLLSVALLLSIASSALAQTHEVRLTTSAEAAAVKKPDTTSAAQTIAGSAGCWPVTSRDQVVVHLDEGPVRKGTLLCMGPEEIMLTGSGTLPLSTIQKIEKPRDGTIDGMLKGAAVGLLIFALCAGECEAEYVLRGTLAYAAIGATIDALQGNNKTIYRRPPGAAIAWRVRF
jgi:hypothetical protein